MKKKLMTLALALGLSLAVLTGCSKPTVESLVDGMFDIESQTAEVEMDIVCTISTAGASFDAVAGGEFEMEVSGMNGKGPQTSHVDGKMTAECRIADVDEKMEFEAYSIVDDGTVTGYSCIDGTWYVNESDDVMDQDDIDKMTEALKDILKENGELAKDTEKVEGEECYVITATIEGSDWSDILKPVRGMLDDQMDEAGVDIDIISWLEYCSADITYYISKDTGYLVKTEMDMSDTDIYNMVGQMIKDIGSLIGFADMYDEYENTIDEISFSTFDITVVFSDVNDTEVKVPRDVINDAVERSATDLMGSIGDDPFEDLPDDPDPYDVPDDPDPIDDPDDDDEWYHGNSFTFNKCDEDDEFLCEVKIPNEYSYDSSFSDPEGGLVCLDRADGNGWIWIQNEAYYPTYAGVLNGELDDSAYEDYEIDITVIGTAFGGSDVMLVTETYSYSGYDYDDTFICIRYDDGGFAEFLTVDCGSMYDLDDWSEDDFLDLARSLFGR